MQRIDQPFTNELATISDHGLATSGNKGTPYVWVDFVFDEVTADDGGQLGVRAYLYLTDKNFPYVLEKLANIGWHGKSIDELDTETNEKILVGRKARLTGDMEEYEGKMRPKVNFINDPDSGSDKPIDKKELTTLAKKLDAKIAAYRQKNGVKEKNIKKTESSESEQEKKSDDNHFSAKILSVTMAGRKPGYHEIVTDCGNLLCNNDEILNHVKNLVGKSAWITKKNDGVSAIMTDVVPF